MALNRFLKVFAWNCNGIKTRIREFREFVNERSPDIVLLQETHLRPEDKLNIKDYTTYRNDFPSLNQSMRGTAIIIKRSIPHHVIILPSLQVINATAINIKINNGSPYTIISTYIPPSLNPREVLADLYALSNINNDTIIFGDLNARHRDWHCTCNNAYGQVINNFSDNSDFDIFAPREPTHHTNHSSSVIDFALIKGIPNSLTIDTICDLSSDHNPVLLKIFISNNPYSFTPKKFVNWKQFKEHLNSKPFALPNIENTNDLESFITKLTSDINDSITFASTIIPDADKRHSDRHLKILINNRNRARKAWQRNKTPINKRIMNNTQQDLKYYIQDKSNKDWDNFLTSLDTTDNSIWKAARRFKYSYTPIPPLKVPNSNNILYTAEEKGNLIGSTLAQNFTPNPGSDVNTTNEVSNSINIIQNFNSFNTNVHIDSAALVKIIKHLPKRKSPGEDNITNTALKHLPIQYVYYIYTIIDHIFYFCYFPSNWKNSIIVPIPKPKKDHSSPDNYRPISLLNTISKITEKFILAEVNNHLDENNIIIPYQFGFRKNLSASHQVYRIAEILAKNKLNKLSTAAVFLDVARAFDKIWIHALIHKLLLYNFSKHLIKLIFSYLSDRTFQVKIYHTLSSKFPILSGVPQGSLLGPTLFNIYINDIPVHPKTELAIYADDTAIFAYNKNYKFAVIAVNKHLGKISEWLERWKIRINTSKCEAAMFTSKQRTTYVNYNIYINNTRIPWSDTVNYLGVTLDKNLTWKQHFTSVKTKYRNAKRALYPLISRHSKMDTKIKLLIYTSFLRPIFTYAAPVWSYAADSNIKILTTIQNLILKEIINAPWYFRNTKIHEELKILPIPNFIYNLSVKFHKNLSNDLINNLVNYDPTDASNRRRPLAILAKDPY